MAKQTLVTLIDDLDGSEAAESVEFGLDGAAYEIDLSEKNAQKLRTALTKFVDNARRVPRSSGSTNRSTSRGRVLHSREHLAAVRDWARKNGFEVSDRGRIASPIMEAFDTAH